MTTPQTTERHGHCLCGSVKITANQAADHVGACHCRMCRRWGGGPFLEIDCGTDVEITGADKVGVFASSEWAERGFCSSCGTSLFYRLKETGEHMVCAGIFDDEYGLSFRSQVFIDAKPAYYSFAERTENLTGEELFAMVQGTTQE